MNRLLVAALAMAALGGSVWAEGPVPSADLRFAKAEGDEAPSFQRHVVPLLGRLGCNGRSCHGSFQGQGGFRLSLFGYDFAADHQAVSARADAKDPGNSLVLRKATRAEPHKGGKRMEKGGWEYNLLLRWLRGGTGDARSPTTLTALETGTKEIVFARVGQEARLKVIARWADGSSEDVTPLCRFRSNDESIATVDEFGRIACVGKGDTHVIAFYDNGVAAVSVLLPVSDKAGGRFPPVPTPTKLDEQVVANYRKLGLVPSELSSDAEFLRRASLDITGTLPAAGEVTAFLADRSADKRTRKVDELLKSPAYAAWWATRLCDITGNNDRAGPLGGEQGLNAEKARRWYDWIRRRLDENVPYDKLVEGMVLATSRKQGQSYEDYCKEMSGYFRKDRPADFSARETMPFFWTRRKLGQPEEKAMSLAYAFLGVRLECAQCHKHPYDQWTKQDFDQFAAFFSGVRYGSAPRVPAQAMKKAVGLDGLDEDSGTYKRKFVALLGEGKVLHFKELSVPPPSKGKARPQKTLAGRVITPRLLGGDEIVSRDYDDPRRPVMDWMRQADNPYFARAFVNRVWAAYFHRGLVDPPDDMNLANPPTNRELLDYLSAGFVENHFDIKWLHRMIVNSRTYQLSHRANDTNRRDQGQFSRHVLRRMPAEALVDAVALATASDEARKAMEKDPAHKRAVGVASCLSSRRGGDNYAALLFGKPARVNNCDCERSSEPSLLQAVYLRNDREALAQIDRPDGWLRQASRSKAALEDLVRQAYLRTLSRLPDERELAAAREHISAAKDTTAGLRDLLWALINTKEFVVVR